MMLAAARAVGYLGLEGAVKRHFRGHACLYSPFSESGGINVPLDSCRGSRGGSFVHMIDRQREQSLISPLKARELGTFEGSIAESPS